MNLASYLKSKHLEYINKMKDVVYESDWIKEELNPRLPAGDKFSVASFNQWMNDDRNPDGKNIIRLVTVFGPEILQPLGIRLHGTLAPIIEGWEDLTPEGQDHMNQCMVELQGLEPAPVAVQV